MPPSQTGDEDAEPPGVTLERAARTRLRSIDSERYRANTETVLTELRIWLETHEGVTHVEAVTDDHCRRWVRDYLRGRVHGEQATMRDGEARAISARSAHTYYNIARAFFSFLVEGEQMIPRNPMQPERVRDMLPEVTADVEQGQQFWTPEARTLLLRHVDKGAHDALDDEDADHERAFRDRAIAYLLADTGARGAELFAVSGDSLRNGITWSDVRGNAIRVFGKSREFEEVQLPEQTRAKLERYKRVLDPGSDEWPVIPTADAATKYRAVRETLRDRGYSEEEREEVLADADIEEVLREYEVAPPALTTEGARRVMKQLSEAADVDVDGEYLKPHGGRRGLGHRAYNEISAERAQDLLRHRDIQTTKDAYVASDTEDLAGDVGSMLYGAEDESEE